MAPAIFDRLRHNPNKLRDTQKNGEIASSTSSLCNSEPTPDAMKASMSRHSVYSDSGISSSSNFRALPPAAPPKKDAVETGSMRSHATCRSTSTYRSGDMSASVSTFKPFVYKHASDLHTLGLETNDNPFERFVEVLVKTQEQPLDTATFQDDAHLWAIFSSSRLNLKIPPDQVRAMRDWFYLEEHDNIDQDFISRVRDLITQLSRERPLYGPSWVAIVDHNCREFFFNRVTGETKYGVPDDFPTLRDMDVFGRTIHEMFYSVTARGINYITLTQFDEICASKKYNFAMKDEEKRALIKGIIKTRDEQDVVYYEDFVPIGRSLLLKWYRQQYPKGGDWLKLSSKRYGFFYLNKMTGETTFRPAQYEREQLSLFLQDTLKEVETLKETLKFTEEESAAVKDQLSSVTAEAEEQGSKSEELGVKIVQLERELTSEKESHEALLNKYDTVVKEGEDLQRDLAHAQESISARDELLEQKEGDITARNAEISERLSEIESLNEELTNLKDEISKANAFGNAKASEAAGLLFDYEEEKKGHDSTLQELDRVREELAVTSAELTGKLCDVEKVYSALQGSETDLRGQLENEVNRGKSLESKVADLTAELREEREVISGLRDQLTTETQKNTMMDGDLRTFKEEHLTAKNKEISEALNLIDQLKIQLELQKDEVRTLKLRHSSKTSVFAQQSEGVFKLKEQLAVLEERDSKHADVLKEAVARAGKVLRRVYARSNSPASIKRVRSCPDLAQPLPPSRPAQFRETRSRTTCWDQPRPTNICQVFTDAGDITLCSREREKVLIMRDQEKVQVRSLRTPKDEAYLNHMRPFSPNCMCDSCRSLVRPRSARKQHLETKDSQVNPAAPLSPGDRVRFRSVRPGYTESRVLEGVVERVGSRRSGGVHVGVNLGVPLGNTDGIIDGERWFRCPPKHGSIVPLSNVLAVFSPKTQTFVPLLLPDHMEVKKIKQSAKRGRSRPKSASHIAASKNSVASFSTISVDERFVRSPYLQSLIAVDPYSPEFKATFTAKPRISRPIPRQKSRNRY